MDLRQLRRPKAHRGHSRRSDYKYLNFQSGYTNFSECLPGQTVAECQVYKATVTTPPVNDGKFFDDGGHMEKHATLLGLGDMDNA